MILRRQSILPLSSMDRVACYWGQIPSNNRPIFFKANFRYPYSMLKSTGHVYMQEHRYPSLEFTLWWSLQNFVSFPHSLSKCLFLYGASIYTVAACKVTWIHISLDPNIAISMTNKNINCMYLFPLSPMRKMKGGMRFDMSPGEVKSPASHIQFHESGTCRDSGLLGCTSEKPKEGQAVFPMSQDPRSRWAWFQCHNVQFVAQPWWLMVPFFRIKICWGLSSWRRKKQNSQVKFLWHSAIEVLGPSHITGNVKKLHSSYNLKNKECPE